MAYTIDADLVSLKMAGTLNGATSYNYAYTFTGTTDNEYRLRLFLDYTKQQDYVNGTTMTGLFLNGSVDSPNRAAVYDDWGCAFRSPLIGSEFADGHTGDFNTELSMPLSNNGTVYLQGYYEGVRDDMVVQTSETSQYVLGGASCIGSATHTDDPSFLVEYKESECTIKRIQYDNGIVTVITDEEHGFSTGDAITISGLPAPLHTTGHNGERFNGTYLINVVDSTTFTYTTQFYSGDGQTTLYGNSDDYIASKWISCAYSVDKMCIINRTIDTVTIQWESHPFVKGDFITVCIGDYVPLYNIMVEDTVDSDGLRNLITCKCDDSVINQFSSDGEVACTLYYAGRVPSSVVPVNYAEDVDNRPSYDHTLTTSLSNPIEDTYFDAAHDGETFSKATSLIVANDSYAAFKICPGNVSYSVDAGAEIRVYVAKSTEASATLGLYTMSSNEWTATSPYSVIDELISADPISIVQVRNDGCSSDALGYYTFIIPTETVQKWILNGTSTVSLAIGAYNVITDGGYVEIASNETNYPMQLILTTGKSSILDPELITVKTVPSTASVGDTISIMVNGYGQFNEFVQNNVVKFNDVDAVVIGGDKNTLKVIVPEGINGNASVTVYSKLGTNLIQITDTVNMTINGQLNAKNKVLAEKLRPGELIRNVSRTAVYCRDLGFNNFTEITDENSLIQNLYSILLTRRGERLFNSEFGTTIEDRIFSIMTENDEISILKECYAAIEKYEPRITIDYEQSHVDVDYDSNTIIVYIGVVLPNGNARYIKLPFKNRGEMV